MNLTTSRCVFRATLLCVVHYHVGNDTQTKIKVSRLWFATTLPTIPQARKKVRVSVLFQLLLLFYCYIVLSVTYNCGEAWVRWYSLVMMIINFNSSDSKPLREAQLVKVQESNTFFQHAY